MIKHAPNILSSLRIVLSFSLIFLIPMKEIFIIVYIITGLTDILDGYIARKHNCSSEFGAKLDSIADFVFNFILLFLFLKQFVYQMEKYHIAILIVIIIVRLGNIIVTLIKYKRVVFVHTLMNKLSGIIVFFMPFLFIYKPIGVLAGVLLLLILIAAIEELLITITSREPDLNRRSIMSFLKL